VKHLFPAARALALDLASTICFVTLFALTGNVVLSVTLGMAMALAQIAWRLTHRLPIDVLQWVSLAVVALAGGATLITHDPLFVKLKPSAIYLLVGCAMLQKGWMLRYMPPRAIELVPDMAIAFGYVWAGLMFFSAALNLVLAMGQGIMAWGTVMALWGTGSKIVLFVLQYAAMRMVAIRRFRAGRGAAMTPATP
jgi:intracellular septation protein A